MGRRSAHADLPDWQLRIDRAKAYLESDGRLDRWKRYRRWYENKYGDGVTSVNLLFAYGRALVPQLYFKAPKLVVMPMPGRKQPEGVEQHAKIVNAIDDWLLRMLGLKQQIKLGIVDAYLTNVAVFKVGYHSLGTELPTNEPEQEPPPGLEGIDEAARAFAPPEAEDETREYSYHDLIRPDMPWVLRTQPEDFLVPDKSRDPDALPWCAFRVVRPIDDVLAEPMYENTDGLRPMPTPEVGRRGFKSPQFDQREEVRSDDVILYEIWDKRDGRIRVFAEGYGKWLRNEKVESRPLLLPFKLLRFNGTGWDFWGPADAQEIEAQVIEYNETRTLEMLHKRTAITKFLYDKNAIEVPEIQKFTRGEQLAIPVDVPAGSSVQAALMQLQPQMSPDLYRVGQELRKDVDDILGFSRQQIGELVNQKASRRTARESMLIQQALQLRSDERRDQVADLLSGLFQDKINPLIFEQWTTERAFEVSGQPGWLSVTPSQIKGDYMVEVVADSILPMSKMMKQAMAIQAYQMLSRDPMVDQYELRKWVLSSFEGVAPDSLLKPKEQIQQEQEQQRKQQMMVDLIKGGAGALAKRGATGGGGAPGDGDGAST